MIAAFGSDAYKIVLVLHILCAIIGFGAVFLNAIYGQQASTRRGPEGLAISEANFLVSRIAEYFIHAVFILGIVLVLIGDDVIDFGQTWVWLSIVLFVIGLGVAHGVLFPTVKQMIALQRAMVSGPPPAGGPPPQAAELERLGKRVAITGPALNALLIVLLVLMVFKPGGPSI